MAATTVRGILKKRAPENERVRTKNVKKGRLIVRNLSFKVTDSHLKEIFGKFGNVVDVNIPTKSDGQNRGFAFVQFERTNDAIKAINNLNSKKILKRPVAVDFAVSKSIYESKKNQSELEVVSSDFKSETKDQQASYSDDQEDADEDVKNHDSGEEKTDSELDSTNKESSESECEESENEHSSADSESDKSEFDDESSRQKRFRKRSDTEEPSQKKFKRNPDAADGRTLFLRNVPFQAHEEDLEDVMEEFGELDYAVLCHNPITDLPKGTAFVRFQDKESAQKCLDKANDDLQGGVMLNGRRLNIILPLLREDAQKLTKKEEKQGKDNRNLYLSREGLIRQGSQAAEGVSKADMALRSRLEYRKKMAMRNLKFFVSRTRLCVHNLPPTLENRQLRDLFLKGANDSEARITEARVMREQKGQGKSKGFAFVEFTEHQHALTALRLLNNNPDVFTFNKRPIVEFSIENRTAINTKLKRQEKSKAQNQNAPMKNSKNLQESSSPRKFGNASEAGNSFSGFKSRRDIKSLPSHRGPKIRHRNSKPEQKKKKKANAPGHKDPESTMESKKKKKGKRGLGRKEIMDIKEDRAFQALVNKYKGNLSTVSDKQREKWYEAD